MMVCRFLACRLRLWISLYFLPHHARDLDGNPALLSGKLALDNYWELWQAGTIAEVGAVSVMLVLLLGIVTFIGRKYLTRLIIS